MAAPLDGADAESRAEAIQANRRTAPWQLLLRLGAPPDGPTAAPTTRPEASAPPASAHCIGSTRVDSLRFCQQEGSEALHPRLAGRRRAATLVVAVLRDARRCGPHGLVLACLGIAACTGKDPPTQEPPAAVEHVVPARLPREPAEPTAPAEPAKATVDPIAPSTLVNEAPRLIPRCSLEAPKSSGCRSSSCTGQGARSCCIGASIA